MITSTGIATGVSAGSATISATLGKVSGNTKLTVTSAATLKSIAVTPLSPSVAATATQQFTATGTYSDNSTADLTSQVTWNSVPTAVATISSAGLATGVAVGTSNITATLGAVVSPVNVLTVTAAGVTLGSITVNPATATIPVGGTADFTATGHYSDGSNAVLAAATWSSGTPATATITGTSFTNVAVPPVTTSVGVALGQVSSGTAVSIKATSGTVFGTASLTVAAPAARNVYVAGASDGSAATYALNTSTASLLPIASLVVNGAQSQIVPDRSGRFVFMLGSNDITTANLDPVTGRISGVSSTFSPNPAVNSNYGVVDPTGQYLYVATFGASSTLNSYLINLTDGSLSPIGSPISGFTNLISVVTDRTGKYLYAIDNDSSVQKVFAYSIGAGGALAALTPASYATGVSPQYSAIDPTNTYLFIPNQGNGSTGGDSISVYNINNATGALPVSQFSV